VASAAKGYLPFMSLILVVVLLLLLFGGGGFYFGGPLIGGGGLGLVLLICLIIFLMGGFVRKRSRIVARLRVSLGRQIGVRMIVMGEKTRGGLFGGKACAGGLSKSKYLPGPSVPACANVSAMLSDDAGGLPALFSS